MKRIPQSISMITVMSAFLLTVSSQFALAPTEGIANFDGLSENVFSDVRESGTNFIFNFDNSSNRFKKN